MFIININQYKNKNGEDSNSENRKINNKYTQNR